jgi:hypothetical protein
MKFSKQIIIVLLFLALHISGQSYQLKLGSKIIGSKGDSYSLIKQNMDGGYQILSTKTSKQITIFDKITTKLYIENMDENFKVKNSKELFSDKEDTYTLGMVRLKNEKVYYLIYELNKKTNKVTYKMFPISGNSETKGGKILFSVTYSDKEEIKNYYTVSADSSKVLIMTEADKNDKKTNYKAYAAVYNENFELINDSKINLDKNQEQIRLIDCSVDNSGSVYVMYKSYFKSEKESENKKPAYSLDFYQIKNKVLESGKEIDLESKYLYNARFKSLNDGSILFSGLFGNTEKDAISGYFLMKWNNGVLDKKIKENFMQKDIDYLKSVENKYIEKDNTKQMGLSNFFVLNNIEVLENGDIFVGIEYMLRKNISMTTISYSLMNREVLYLLKFDKNLKYIKSFYLNKNQSGEFSGAIAINFFHENNDFFILYNEDEDNMKKSLEDKNPKRTMKFGDFVPAIIKIDGNSRMTRTFFSNTDNKGIVYPSTLSKEKDYYRVETMFRPGVFDRSFDFTISKIILK